MGEVYNVWHEKERGQDCSQWGTQIVPNTQSGSSCNPHGCQTHLCTLGEFTISPYGGAQAMLSRSHNGRTPSETQGI